MSTHFSEDSQSTLQPVSCNSVLILSLSKTVWAAIVLPVQPHFRTPSPCSQISCVHWRRYDFTCRSLPSSVVCPHRLISCVQLVQNCLPYLSPLSPSIKVLITLWIQGRSKDLLCTNTQGPTPHQWWPNRRHRLSILTVDIELDGRSTLFQHFFDHDGRSINHFST